MDDNTAEKEGSMTARGIKRDIRGEERDIDNAHTLPQHLTRPPPAAPARVRFSSLPGHPWPGPAHSHGTETPPQHERFSRHHHDHDGMPPPPVPSHRILPSSHGRSTVQYTSQQSFARVPTPSHGQHEIRAYETNQQTPRTIRPYRPEQAPAHNSSDNQGDGEQKHRSRHLPPPRPGPTREYLHSLQHIMTDRQRHDEMTEEEAVRFFSTQRMQMRDRRGRGDDPGTEQERRE